MTPFARLVGLIALALAAGAAAQDAPHPSHAEHGSLAGVAPLADRSLGQIPGDWTDQDGRPFALAALRGSPTLLVLFYGTCDSVCPAIVHDLQKLEAGLPAADRARTRFVLVTIDPAVDTPQRLREYALAHALDPARWKLLHGRPEQVRVLANVLGVRYRPSGGGQYSHTIRVTLLDGDAVVAGQFDGLPVSGEPIAAQIHALLGG